MFMEVLPLGLSIQWPIHSYWGAGEYLASLLQWEASSALSDY